MPKIPRRLGEILIDSGILTERQLTEALETQESTKKFLGEVLIEMGFITKDKLELALARQFGSKLGEILLKNSMIDWHQLSFALRTQEESLRPLGEILLQLGYITNEQLIKAICERYGFEYVDLSQVQINLKAIDKLPRDFCIQHNVLPIDIKGKTLILAMADPEDIIAIDDARLMSKMEIKPVVTTFSAIKLYLQ